MIQSYVYAVKIDFHWDQCSRLKSFYSRFWINFESSDFLLKVHNLRSSPHSKILNNHSLKKQEKVSKLKICLNQTFTTFVIW